MAAEVRVGDGLAERVARLLPAIAYRRATSADQREEIFRLRYDAYLREGAILPRSDRLFRDAVDEAANTFVYGIYAGGELASAMRLSVTLPGAPDIPTAQVFPDILEPEIRAGRRFVDPTRFVADHAMSRRLPELPYLALRLPWMAMEHFCADVMLAAVRPEHEAFYRRLWGNRTLCAARPYPGLVKPVSLTALDFAEMRDAVERRHPFFVSSAAERFAVFGDERGIAFPAPLAAGHGARPRGVAH